MVSGITKSIAENCADITGYAPGDGKGNEIMQSIAKIGEEVKERQKKEGVFQGHGAVFFMRGYLDTRKPYKTRHNARAGASLAFLQKGGKIKWRESTKSGGLMGAEYVRYSLRGGIVWK